MKNVFICSKPLQFLNIKNIVNNERYNNKLLIIIDNFKSAKTFKDKILIEDKSWDNIRFFKSRRAAYLYLIFVKIDSLFLDFDAGFDYFFLNFIRYNNFIVYEEGYGTYNPNYSTINNSNFIKSLLIKKLGSKKSLGESKLTKEIYVYKSVIYKKLKPQSTKKIHSFKKSFENNLLENKELFEKIYSPFNELENLSNKNISIYLTSWEINTSILKKMREQIEPQDYIFIKPHPNIRNINNHYLKSFTVIEDSIPIEFILILLLENNNRITIYHECSSSLIYLLKYKNLVSLNMVHNKSSSTYLDYKLVEDEFIRD